MEREAQWNRRDRFLLFAVFFLLFAVRLYGINNPPFEMGEYWRQPDTESIALNFIHYRFSILQPNFLYDGPLPNVVALELQVITPIIAVLYKLFGHHYFLARSVSILFFLGSCAYLYALARRYVGKDGAIWATLLYGLFPVNLFLSRSIQPEPAALFFYVGSLYYFQRYREAQDRAGYWVAASGLFLAVAIMEKPQTALIGLPMLGLAWQKYGRRLLCQWQLWLFALLTLGIPVAYFVYSNSVAEFRFVQGIVVKHIIPKALYAWRTPQAMEFFRTNLPKALTTPGLVILGLSLLDVRRKLSIVYLWLLGVLVYLVTVESVIRFWYYLVYITPPLAILMGALLSRFKGLAQAVPALLVTAIAVVSFQVVRPLYTLREDIIKTGRIVQQITDKDDLIVISTEAPALINASQRQGWRFQLHYYPHIPTDPIEELQYYIDRGAKYFVTLRGEIYRDEDGKIREYLDAHFPKLEPEPGYVIYQLRPDANGSDETP